MLGLVNEVRIYGIYSTFRLMADSLWGLETGDHEWHFETGGLHRYAYPCTNKHDRALFELKKYF